jgi:hypothetical protein
MGEARRAGANGCWIVAKAISDNAERYWMLKIHGTISVP